jgi:hypothetical protein
MLSKQAAQLTRGSPLSGIGRWRQFLWMLPDPGLQRVKLDLAVRPRERNEVFHE